MCVSESEHSWDINSMREFSDRESRKKNPHDFGTERWEEVLCILKRIFENILL